MANITAAMVKELREITGAGMMDCKKALSATDGDKDKAIDFLREKGIAKAEKKAGRIASEGVVASYVSEDGKIASVVEVNCETDFVANTDNFHALVNKLAKHIADTNPADMDALNESVLDGKKVSEFITEMVASIGEKISIRRFERYESTGLIGSYIHMGGKIGVMVNMEVSGIDGEKVVELGKDIAMQIAAMNPSFLDKSQVDSSTLDKEKEILMAQAKEDPKNANKPENIIEKMVMGRIGKYYEENCLMQQAFVKENKISVEQHVAAVAKELGGSIKVLDFTRFETGEGIEKKEEDFAAEVAAQMNMGK